MNDTDRSTNSSIGKIIVFSAASGAGKTTLLDHLRSVMPDLVYSISTTTRPPRNHEINGVHYNFVSVEQFEQMIKDEAFAEWAKVHENYYGSPKKFIDEAVVAGSHVVMDIDVYGKKIFDETYPNAMGVFLKPPSLEELENRLRNRRTDSDEVIAVRLANAKKEMAFARSEGKYEYVIVNDSLSRAQEEVVTLVHRIIQE